MIVISIMGIIIGIAVPGWLRARCQSQMKSCQENLSKIDGAKEQWALSNNQDKGATPAQDELVSKLKDGYLKSFPKEPSGGNYVINAIGTDPECDKKIPGHSVGEIGLAVTECAF